MFFSGFRDFRHFQREPKPKTASRQFQTGRDNPRLSPDSPRAAPDSPRQAQDRLKTGPSHVKTTQDRRKTSQDKLNFEAQSLKKHVFFQCSQSISCFLAFFGQKTSKRTGMTSLGFPGLSSQSFHGFLALFGQNNPKLRFGVFWPKRAKQTRNRLG